MFVFCLFVPIVNLTRLMFRLLVFTERYINRCVKQINHGRVTVRSRSYLKLGIQLTASFGVASGPRVGYLPLILSLSTPITCSFFVSFSAHARLVNLSSGHHPGPLDPRWKWAFESYC